VSRHLGSLVLAGALLLTTAACSDDTPDDPEPSASPSGDPSSSTPESSAPPTTETPTPTVTPAAGIELRQGTLSVRAPAGWGKTPEPSVGGFSEQADDPALLSTLFISELPDLAPGTEIDLDQLARSAIKNAHYLRDPEIVAPVDLDGVAWFHTSGQIDSATYEDMFGTITGGFQLRVVLRTGIDVVPAAEREELLASILATVELDLA
jgi:hypothetical protein